MKKIVFALMALAMLAVSVSCKKEPPSPPQSSATAQIVVLDNTAHDVA